MNQSSPQSQDNSEDRPRPDAGSSRSLLAGAALQAEEGATLSLRKEVRRVIENEELSPKEKVQALLQAGLDWFGLEVGFLAEIDLTESSHRTVVAAGAHPKLQEGADADLPDTYCREIVTQSEVLTIEDAAQQGWAKDPAYQKYDLSCYLGAKIIVEGQLYGTVCFGSREPSPEPMGPGDEAVLELVAQSIEQAIEQGRQQRETDQLRGKYELLLEAAPNAIVLAEIDTGRIVEANRRAAEMIGAEEEEIAGRHQTELHPSGEAARYRRLFRECCRPGVEGTVRRFEDGSPIYIQTEEGKKVPVAISAATVEVGARQLAVGIFRDVSERRRRERELRHRSDAMEAASDGIAILSSEGTYQYVNQAHADIYGYDAPEPLLGRSWTVCYDDDERQRLEAEAMPELHEKGQWRGEALGQRADGSSFPQELSLTRLEDGSIICVVRDITAQKRREEALRAAKEEAETARAEAEAASQAKSALLANMSHEIRTPLTSIIGFAEVLGEEAQEGETASHFAGLIEKSGRRLLSTLDGVLNLSKLEAGQMELERMTVDLAEQAEAIAGELRPKAEEKGLSLQADTGEAAVRARADEGGVQIVLQNLVSNAIKYTEEGTVQVRVYRADGKAVLDVEDTGIGMEPEVVEGLFEPFRQESEGLDREYEGTGLGLAVTKKAVDQMDGSIEVETSKGGGSRFIVRLTEAHDRGAS